MTSISRKRAKRCLFSNQKRYKKGSHTNHLQKILSFLKVEKTTFNFIKLLSTFFFTLEIGILATLFHSNTFHFIFIFFAIFTSISLFFLFLSLLNFMKSLFSIIDSDNQFFLYRKKGHKYLNISIYTCLLNFTISCFIYNTLL